MFLCLGFLRKFVCTSLDVCKRKSRERELQMLIQFGLDSFSVGLLLLFKWWYFCSVFLYVQNLKWYMLASLLINL